MLVRYAVAFKPALHRSMISMSQLARHRADAATFPDDVCVSHTQVVRFERTSVNVENVNALTDNVRMADDSTLGAKLRSIQERSGRSYREIAKAAGYSGASSVQRYFDDTYDAVALPLNVASKLAKGFTGSRVPPEEIMALAGLPSMLEAEPFQPGRGPRSNPRDIPVYGTALGTLLEIDSDKVEQTFLDTTETIAHFSRPQALNQRADVYGVYIQGSSMAPRFQEGEMAFVEGNRPPQVGDDVLVFLRSPEDDGERVTACLIKRLVRRSGSYIELEQFNPPVRFKIDAGQIQKVHRVIPWGELLA